MYKKTILFYKYVFAFEYFKTVMMEKNFLLGINAGLKWGKMLKKSRVNFKEDKTEI